MQCIPYPFRPSAVFHEADVGTQGVGDVTSMLAHDRDLGTGGR